MNPRAHRVHTPLHAPSIGTLEAMDQVQGKMKETQDCKGLGVDSFPILFNRSFLKNRIRFPWAFAGFLKRFGPLERMELEGTPRKGAERIAESGQRVVVLLWVHRLLSDFRR